SAARSTTTSSGRSRGIRGWWLAEERSAGGRIKAYPSRPALDRLSMSDDRNPFDRQSRTRPRCAAVLARPRRRGDRVSQCPLLAKGGHADACRRMSAFGGKPDIEKGMALCPLLTQSGHWVD